MTVEPNEIYDIYDITRETVGNGSIDLDSLGMICATLFLAVLIMVPFVIFFTICYWKIYKKAGEPGWASLIPFYSDYALFKIACGSGWLFLLTLVPFIGSFAGLYCRYKLSIAFGKDVWFALGMILLPVIFMPMLAFSKDTIYIGPS